MKMTKSSQNCSICMEEFERGTFIFYLDSIIKKLPCGHILHRECGKTFFSMNIKCPICRMDLLEFFRSMEIKKTEKKKEIIKVKN